MGADADALSSPLTPLRFDQCDGLRWIGHIRDAAHPARIQIASTAIAEVQREPTWLTTLRNGDLPSLLADNVDHLVGVRIAGTQVDLQLAAQPVSNLGWPPLFAGYRQILPDLEPTRSLQAVSHLCFGCRVWACAASIAAILPV